MAISKPADVLGFWFKETKPSQHFKKNAKFDQKIRDRFGTTLERATRGELYAWRGTLAGRLAEIIVLDQFSRNLFRDTARAFAQDTMALVLAQETILDPRHLKLPAAQRAFLYMPFMHSESLAMHDLALTLFSAPGLKKNLQAEIKHREILLRFGRYPHRNRALGRVSTPEEAHFLRQPGSSF